MKTRYQFIHFIKLEGEKVISWSCRNNRSNDELGRVQWYAPWKLWCFIPTQPSVYSAGCLADIQDFIKQMQK